MWPFGYSISAGTRRILVIITIRCRVMRSSFLSMAALLSLANPATSADKQPLLYKTAALAAPVWNWTGCYAGGQADGLWGQSTKWIVRTPGGAFANQSLGGHEVDSWGGGAQAGCDYQFAGGFVTGLRGDYAFMGGGGSHASAHEFGVSYHSYVESLASVTGRVGYVWGRFLGYVRGGAAWERDKYSATTIFLGTAHTADETLPGWTVGIGGEYAFTDFLSGFFEYSYYDFGTHRISFNPQLSGLRPAFADVQETRSVVRAGLNFHFWSYAAPVALRY
jgi:outer membrane immunogenic protein